jgi:E1A/CREB-binding protein
MIPGLPATKLSTFLEDRVNKFILSTNTPEAGKIIVRVVSSTDKILDTRMLMKERYTGEFPEQFPYRSKAMFVFEEIDGVEVCFFGMHVQEYGSDCQAPNTRYGCKGCG